MLGRETIPKPLIADTYKSLCSKGQFLNVRYFSIPTGKRYTEQMCPVHNRKRRQTSKNGRSWPSQRTNQGRGQGRRGWRNRERGGQGRVVPCQGHGSPPGVIACVCA